MPKDTTGIRRSAAELDEEVSEEEQLLFKIYYSKGDNSALMKTQNRAPVPEGANILPVPCRRCTTDLDSFPDACCFYSPVSTALKCQDCVRKSKECLPVSESPVLS